MGIEPGRIVILNGASSVGKSTLANEFVAARAERGDCWVVVAIDDFNAKLPWQWFDIVKVSGPYGYQGVRFVPSPEGMVVAVGAVGRRLFASYRRSVAVWARAGFNVVVDEVCFDKDAADDWDEALAGLPVNWIGVRCDPGVAAARELARGDRVIGLARGLSAVVHRYRTYDLELDAGSFEPAELVARLEEFVEGFPRPPGEPPIF